MWLGACLEALASDAVLTQYHMNHDITSEFSRRRWWRLHVPHFFSLNAPLWKGTPSRGRPPQGRKWGCKAISASSSGENLEMTALPAYRCPRGGTLAAAVSCPIPSPMEAPTWRGVTWRGCRWAEGTGHKVTVASTPTSRRTISGQGSHVPS